MTTRNRPALPSRGRQVMRCDIGCITRRNDRHIFVGRQISTRKWIGGLITVHSVVPQWERRHGHIGLTDGCLVSVGALLSEAALDSYEADLMIEAVEREADIEDEVEILLADPARLAEISAYMDPDFGL